MYQADRPIANPEPETLHPIEASPAMRSRRRLTGINCKMLGYHLNKAMAWLLPPRRSSLNALNNILTLTSSQSGSMNISTARLST